MLYSYFLIFGKSDFVHGSNFFDRYKILKLGCWFFITPNIFKCFLDPLLGSIFFYSCIIPLGTKNESKDRGMNLIAIMDS